MTRLVARGLVKRYGATRALDGLDLDIASGHIVGVAGPNGAGKSTLMRLLAGEEKPDAGEIVLTGAGGPVPEAWRRVAVVHQEPHVWPNMTVEENLAVGRETGRFGRFGANDRASYSALERLGIKQFAHYQLADLSLAVQQRVEIARAMVRDADVYLFDEPNSALTEQESAALFETMAELSRDGRIVLLITHRLNDFVRACGRVLILRDGRIGATLAEDGLSETAIAAELTAGDASERSARRIAADRGASAAPAALLSLRNCSDKGGAFRDVSLELSRGLIVALAGVEGSGARELAQVIGGFRAASGLSEPGVATPSTAYLAASRRHTVFHNMSVGENLAVRLERTAIAGNNILFSPSRIDVLGRSGIARYRVKASDAAAPIGSLSGGNQQKVVLGAAMERDAEILVVEEPTRGVDISSKADIYGLLRSFAASGRSVVIFCTEVQEMFDGADEVVVLSRGRVVGRVDLAEVNDIPALAEILAAYESAE
jgi:ABC-type sugar transport system ATPase subunit